MDRNMKGISLHQHQTENLQNQLDRTALPADVQRVLVVKEEVPLEWSSSPDQPDQPDQPEPETLRIKEEEEEFRIGPEETDVSEEELRSPQRVKTEDGSSSDVKPEVDEVEGPDLVWNPYLTADLQIRTVEKNSQSSGTDASDDDWQEPLSGLGPEGSVTLSGGTGEKQFHCGICGKIFKHRYELKRHMIVHTGEKPYGCRVCGKRFSNQGNVKRHMSFHTGGKPYGCDLCGYRFDEKVHLEKHMRVHSGENPLRCDSCGKHFKYPSDLKIHMRVHTGEAPFQCDICGKMFKYRCDLTKHGKVHAGKPQFQCDVCNKRFTYQSSLKKHMSLHAQEKTFDCDDCDENNVTIKEVN
ncbi:gastrula zinc finger protein XlCGF8.2DB-like [Cololabis saira]|uniref:gastrula zinc finger protein XlCGF8.2DB-like n=1 Tax=Cololabis saira TaxID=129043 RepID=UPI002AD3869C|nr:gastrula zinc finger protein XlCGF8.2DB-like [Cololabis saira]